MNQPVWPSPICANSTFLTILNGHQSLEWKRTTKSQNLVLPHCAVHSWILAGDLGGEKPLWAVRGSKTDLVCVSHGSVEIPFDLMHAEITFRPRFCKQHRRPLNAWGPIECQWTWQEAGNRTNTLDAHGIVLACRVLEAANVQATPCLNPVVHLTECLGIDQADALLAQ